MAAYDHAEDVHDGTPVLIDSGASCAVYRIEWLGKWGASSTSKLAPRSRSFRFGDGEAQGRIGVINLAIDVPAKYVSSGYAYQCVIDKDVVNSEVHLLLPRQTLPNMSDQLDFAENSMWLLPEMQIPLIATGIGLIQFPAETTPSGDIRLRAKSPPETQDIGNDRASGKETQRIRPYLGHRIEPPRRNLLQEARRDVSEFQIQELSKRCAIRKF